VFDLSLLNKDFRLDILLNVDNLLLEFFFGIFIFCSDGYVNENVVFYYIFILIKIINEINFIFNY
jgi:hypothetical protein